MKVGQIIVWFDVWKFGRYQIGVIIVGVIQIGVVYFGVDAIQINVIQNFRIFVPNFFNFWIILAPSFFLILSPPGFSILLIAEPCHDAILLEKSNIFVMESKMLKIPCTITCGVMPLMILGGFILILPLLLRLNPLLHAYVRLSGLPKEMFRITVPPSVNGSGRLVRVDYNWVTHIIVQILSITPKGLRASYRKLIRHFIYNQQQYCFRPRTVGVIRLVRH